MKQTFLFAIMIAAFLTSCSSDDKTASDSKTAGAYFPESNGNYWTYDVATSDQSNRDSLYVLKDTVINSKTYKRLNTKTTPFGFMSSSLNKNGVRVDGNKILLCGGLGLDFSSALPIDFKLDDFVMFKENATANEQLAISSGTITQKFQDFPLNIDYTLRSVAQADIPTYTTKNGETYNDIKPVLFTLQLKISTVYSGFPITIMNNQTVISSTQYYVKNVGIIYTNTQMNYQLQDFAKYGIDLPMPQSGSQSQEETLHSYYLVSK